jgi:beta-lactamase superfamily II metal-dependent hydrolase
MKLVWKIGFVCLMTFLPLTALSAADTWEMTVVDTEGGKAIVMLTPDGESMLVDAGFPGNNDRDTQRIVAAAEELKIKQFDYMLIRTCLWLAIMELSGPTIRCWSTPCIRRWPS